MLSRGMDMPAYRHRSPKTAADCVHCVRIARKLNGDVMRPLTDQQRGHYVINRDFVDSMLNGQPIPLINRGRNSRHRSVWAVEGCYVCQMILLHLESDDGRMTEKQAEHYRLNGSVIDVYRSGSWFDE